MRRVLGIIGALVFGVAGLIVGAACAEMQLTIHARMLTTSGSLFWLLGVLGGVLLFLAGVSLALTRIGAAVCGALVLVLWLLAVVPVPIDGLPVPLLARVLHFSQVLVLLLVGPPVGLSLLLGGLLGKRIRAGSARARILGGGGGVVIAVAVVALVATGDALYRAGYIVLSGPPVLVLAGFAALAMLLAVGMLTARWSSLGLGAAAALLSIFAVIMLVLPMLPDGMSLLPLELLTVAITALLFLPAGALGGLAVGSVLRQRFEYRRLTRPGDPAADPLLGSGALPAADPGSDPRVRG